MSFSTVLENVFANARYKGILLEDEVYFLLERIGLKVPQYQTVWSPENNIKTAKISGKDVVIKIMSPHIMHKTDVGGLEIVENNRETILQRAEHILSQAPLNEANFLAAQSTEKQFSKEKWLEKIKKDGLGLLLAQKMEFSKSFGHELLVSIKQTREFGPVITAGLGGVQTEIWGKSLKDDLAVVSAAIYCCSLDDFFQLFKATLSYQALRGLIRGSVAVTDDEKLYQLFKILWTLAQSETKGNVLQELEINPFVFVEGDPYPLDGLARFGFETEKPKLENEIKPAYPYLESLFYPKTVAISGVSGRGLNFGRIVLQNFLKQGFLAEDIFLIRPDNQAIDGVKAYEGISGLPQMVDLLVVLIPASAVLEQVQEIIAKKVAKAVILIPGALGETDDSRIIGEELEKLIQKERRQNKENSPIFLGGNCLGIISRPAKIDTIFIPEIKSGGFNNDPNPNKGGLAVISQSGAFIVTKLSRFEHLNPNYFTSVGNQTDLTLADICSYFVGRKDVQVILLYVEGFRDFGGLVLANEVKKAVLCGQEVIFYKAGKTPEGKDLSMGHTASLAGDHHVALSVLKEAGALVANDLEELVNLTNLSMAFHGKKVANKRLGALSTAGFEAVGIADTLVGKNYEIEAAQFTVKTIKALQYLFEKNGLGGLVTIRNPLDTNPGSDDQLFYEVAKIIVADPNVDALIMGLMPQAPRQKTLPQARQNKGYFYEDPDSIISLMLDLTEKSTKPILLALDGGQYHDDVINYVERKVGVVFRSVSVATRSLGRYLDYRLRIKK